LKANVARTASGYKIPMAPFFGQLAVAPAAVFGRQNSKEPREFGGNLDCKELTAGSTIYLPVWNEGALFSTGDGHAAQGDGEVDGTAIETALTGTFEFNVKKKLGWKTQPTAMVIFENCRVPVSNRIGAEGQGFKIAMAGLDGGRLNIGACSVGGAQFCLDRTVEYMKERRQFGSRLADFQALQFRIADFATELDAARLLLHRAAVAVGAGEPAATRLAAQAKRLATDTGFEVVNGCLQLHGGYGYLRDHPIERVLRDVRVHQILEGTNEIMRVIVSRAMLGN